MATIIISSQRYLDEAIIAEKSAAADYIVSLSPEFEYDGKTLQVVLDGHHSYAAAMKDGSAPEYNVMTSAQNDTISLLETGEQGIEDFFELNRNDADWYDIETGKDIW